MKKSRFTDSQIMAILRPEPLFLDSAVTQEYYKLKLNLGFKYNGIFYF